MTRTDMYVDEFTGLRRHTAIHTGSSLDTLSATPMSCTRIYHATNIMWELVDHIEMWKTYPSHAPCLPIRPSLSDAMFSGGVSKLFKVLHDDAHSEETKSKRPKRKFAGTGVNSSRTYPDHETVCGHIEKSRRMASTVATKQRVVSVKRLSAQNEYTTARKKNAFLTPFGVYDHTTCHKLVH